jgi:ferric-dicitrate binding protein FerR (iron transport regulator)
MENKQTPENPDWDMLLEQLELKSQAGEVLDKKQLQILQELREIKSLSHLVLRQYYRFDTDQKLAELRKQLSSEPEPAHPVGTRSYKLWKRMLVAASVLLVVAAGLVYYNRFVRSPELVEYTGQVKAVIEPGKTRATLTLGNGKKIVLGDQVDGVIAQEGGAALTKAANGQLVYEKGESGQGKTKALFNTVETPKGGQYQIKLPDGTKVWLNAVSKLFYPVSFNGCEDRRVELSGEAYFEVARDEKHPFIVKSDGQEVKVLGTHFNICGYLGQGDTRTTLLEGSVNLNGTLLKPNQQGVLTAKGVEVKEVDVESVIDWKNGNFICANTNLEDLLSKIGRWYDVHFEYSREDICKDKFTGTLSRTDHISTLLNRIALTGEIRFVVEGRVIKVIKVEGRGIK